MNTKFQLVDVFAGEKFKGNPVAVVTGCADLYTEQMLDITRWLNLSETTFLLGPDDPQADYRVRIFTLDREMPFAGHPTLGTCHAWLEQGGKPRGEIIVQQCGAGLIPIRKTAKGLAFAAPPLLRDGVPTQEELDRALHVTQLDPEVVVEARWIDNGPGWLGLRLKSAQDVLAARPLGAFAERVDIGLVGPHSSGSPIDWELRAIFSDQNRRIVEDPITGSLNASVAQWLIGAGLAESRYNAAQGTAMGRVGRIFVEQDDSGEIWIAGATETMFSGAPTF